MKSGGIRIFNFADVAHVLALFVLLTVDPAGAGFLDLDRLKHGETLLTESPGVTIVAAPAGTAEVDISISDGMISGTRIEDTSEDAPITTIGANPAAAIRFDFDIPDLSLGLDLADIKRSSAHHKGIFAEFFDRASWAGTTGWNMYRSTSLDRIEPLTVSELQSGIGSSFSSMGEAAVGLSADRNPADSPSRFAVNSGVVYFSAFLLFGMILVGVYAGLKKKEN